MVQNKQRENRGEIRQPLTPEQVDPAQKEWQKQEMDRAEGQLTLNPGDRIDDSKTLEEKAQQVAVDAPDIAGHVTVPTYFIVDYPNGERKALHHVKDAKEISDVIRQARMDENGNQIWC
jgi:hypothetical protein